MLLDRRKMMKSNYFFGITTFLIISSPALGQINDVLADTEIFSKTILNLLEKTVKYRRMQTYLNVLAFEEKQIEKTQVRRLRHNLFLKFDEKNKMIYSLQKAAIEAVQSKREYSNIIHCCEVATGLYSDLHKTKVDLEKICLFSTNFEKNEDAIFADTFLKQSIENLLVDQNIIWQYFYKDSTNSYFLYPATSAFCRVNPEIYPKWFIQDIGISKNVVILIDQSLGFQGQPKLYFDIATKAASFVISSLRINDKFAIIPFSAEPMISLPSDGSNTCFFDDLAQAITLNLNSAKKTLKDLSSKGGSNYQKALQKAFRLFKKEKMSNPDNFGKNTQQVILMVSKGSHDDPVNALLENVRNWQKSLNDLVLILTYELGNSVDSTLKKLVELNKVQTQTSQYMQFSDPNQLLVELPKYQKHLKLYRKVSTPSWTSLFTDPISKDVTLSPSLPVFVDNQFIGVVGLYVSFLNLFADSYYFRPNEFSYTFVVDENGYLLHHLYYHPLREFSETVKVRVTDVEREPQFLSVYESLISGGNGRKTFLSTQYIKLGGGNIAYQTPISLMSTYIWNKIVGSPFFICFVLFNNGRSLKLASNVSVPHYLHHRIDLVEPKAICDHFNTLSTTSQTSVYLSPRCYKDVEGHKYHSYTKEDVETIQMFMEGRGSNKFQISEKSKQDVFITFKLDDFWNASSLVKSSSSSILWRFVITASGVYRVFPAVGFPQVFDPLATPQFNQAIASKNKVILSTPTSDWATHLRVIKISKSLTQDQNGESSVFGILGFDMFFNDFVHLFQKSYTKFFTSKYRLYIFDETANLIVYKRYFNETHDIYPKPQHFLEVEPEIASSLIKHKIFIKVLCKNFYYHVVESTYKVSDDVKELKSEVLIGGLCYSYIFQVVPGTNLFVVVRESSTNACLNSDAERNCLCGSKVCTLYGSDECECPCSYLNPFFKPCNNWYDWQESERTRNLTSICSIQFQPTFHHERTNYYTLPPCIVGFNSEAQDKAPFLLIVILVTVVFFCFQICYQIQSKKKFRKQKLQQTAQFANRHEEYPLYTTIHIKSLLNPLSSSMFEEYRDKFFSTRSNTTGSSSAFNEERAYSFSSLVPTQSDTTLAYANAVDKAKATISFRNLKPCRSF